jgi:anti-sigma B factor antagonist
MQELKVTTNTEEGISIVHVNGYIDASANMNFGLELNSLLEQELKFLVLETSGIEYINSQGIGVLVSIVKKIEKLDGKICFLNPSDEIKHIIELTGLTQIFTLFFDKKEAIAYCKQV